MSFSVPTLKPFINKRVINNLTSSTLLLHFDEVSTTVNDSSSNNISVSYYSYQNTSQSVNSYTKFGAGSFYNVNGFATITNSSLFNFASNDFTIDFWYKPFFASDNNSTAVIQMYHFHSNFYNNSNSPLPGIGLRRNSRTSNNFRLQLSSDGSTLDYDASAMAANDGIFDNVVGASDPNMSWYHIALERYNNYIYFYIDGQIESSFAYTNSIYNNTMYNLGFGQCWTATFDANNTTDGYYDELRIVNGIGLYGGVNFTPPISAYTS